MINRVLIRTRCLQQAYAYSHRTGMSVEAALEELEKSLNVTYELYLYFFKLIEDLTDLHIERLNAAKLKHIPTKADLNPNMRLATNPLADMVRRSEQVGALAGLSNFDWRADDRVLTAILKRIYADPCYAEFLDSPEGLPGTRHFWSTCFRGIIFLDEDLAEIIETASIYWDSQLRTVERIEVEDRPEIEDVDAAVEAARGTPGYTSARLVTGSVEVVKDFVDKTLRRIKRSDSLDAFLMPRFRDEVDRAYSRCLLEKTLAEATTIRPLIEKHANNWDGDRMAEMDLLILQMGIAEILFCPDIPIGVTINEHIDLAKMFSSPNSAKFVNGVLDAVAQELVEQGRVEKTVKESRPTGPKKASRTKGRDGK